MAKSKTESKTPAFKLASWLASSTEAPSKPAKGAKKESRAGTLLVLPSKPSKNPPKWRKLGAALAPWQEALLDGGKEDVVGLETANGPVWVVRPRPGAEDAYAPSPYAAAREACGSVARAIARYKLTDLEVRFVGCREEEEFGALVGLELAAYRFQDYFPAPQPRKDVLPRLRIRRADGGKVSPGTLRRAADLGGAVNLARHLVNLPPAHLNPRTFAEGVEELFAGARSVTVSVWDESRLRTENMNLLLAVGQAAPETSRLVHLRYRPRGKKGKKPLAFVGKGITFDTGGLDLKPAAGMRYMKKDMGGAAAMTALAWWLEQSGHPQACDLYLALAENAIDGAAFHPSDVIVSRAGISVEIDNTDAEGRLVLADALDVAVKAKGADAPVAILDAATLTGAGKVGLGVEVSSLFCNHDGLARAVESAGWDAGDPCWRMPLYTPYAKKLGSSFADVVNSAADGMGGAITAALFLEKFVNRLPWAHLDIYAWNDAPRGGLLTGGSGQGVQGLIRFVEEFKGLKSK